MVPVMPISVNLSEDRRILHITFNDPWGIADLRSALVATGNYLDAASHNLHRLVDVSRSRRIPPGILPQLRDSFALDHRNNGEFALVGGTTAIRTYVELALRLAHIDRARFFDTEEAAWIYLRTVIAAGNATPSDAGQP
jgi:hypothetical protein